MSPSYEVGYALSGGFIKGFAHLGAVQALAEYDIHPQIIAGTSAGALAGAFLADGNEPYRCLDYFRGETFRHLTRLALTSSGLLSLEPFVHFLKKNIKARRIEELQIPLLVVATDLDHGRSVVFREGSLAERIAASCSMPVLFAPREVDGTTYVDGGILRNLPVSCLRRQCRNVVAVNVSPLQAPKYRKNLWGIALRTYHFMFESNSLPERQAADLLVEPRDLAGYSNTEMEKAEEIFLQGYRTCQETIKQNLQKYTQIWKPRP